MHGSNEVRKSRRPVVAAGAMLGIGMGGFADGIVAHKILQVHNMLSAKYPTRGVNAETLVVNLEINMFWDGLFHALTWIVTAIGLAMLWGVTKRPDVLYSTKAYLGAMLFGWGLFNLVEGVIDHHRLHLHHVVETANHLPWDLAFLGSGVLLMALGAGLISAARDDHRMLPAS